MKINLSKKVMESVRSQRSKSSGRDRFSKVNEYKAPKSLWEKYNDYLKSALEEYALEILDGVVEVHAKDIVRSYDSDGRSGDLLVLEVTYEDGRDEGITLFCKGARPGETYYALRMFSNGLRKYKDTGEMFTPGEDPFDSRRR